LSELVGAAAVSVDEIEFEGEHPIDWVVRRALGGRS
jgi:hypothetical protein